MYPVLDSVLDAMLSCSEVVWLLPMFDVDVSIKSFAGLCNCQRELPQTHTHTLAQKQLIELLMWNASNVQKTPQLNLTGTVGWLEVRNCAKVIFLRPCSKDLCLFAVSDALLGFLIRMPKPSRVGTDCFSCLSLFLFAKWMMMTWNQRWKREQRKVRTGHAFPWLTGFRAHTHTCSEISYRITDVECIKRAKNTSVKSDRNGWMIRSEKLCEGNLSTSLLEGLTSSDAAQSDCENPCKLKLSSKMTSTRGPHTKVQVLHLLRWITHTPRSSGAFVEGCAELSQSCFSS